MSQDSKMTAGTIIDQIKHLPELEKAQVIQFVQQLTPSRPTTAVEQVDPPAVQALKRQIKRGLAPRRTHA